MSNSNIDTTGEGQKFRPQKLPGKLLGQNTSLDTSFPDKSCTVTEAGNTCPVSFTMQCPLQGHGTRHREQGSGQRTASELIDDGLCQAARLSTE